MSKLIEGKSTVCALRDVYFQVFADHHKLWGSLYLGTKVNLVLSDYCYNVQTDWNEQNFKYGLSLLEDIKYMAKILRIVRKQGAHVHVFCSAVRFVF